MEQPRWDLECYLAVNCDGFAPCLVASWCYTIKSLLGALAGFARSDQSEFTAPRVVFSSEKELIHPAFMRALFFACKALQARWVKSMPGMTTLMKNILCDGI